MAAAAASAQQSDVLDLLGEGAYVREEWKKHGVDPDAAALGPHFQSYIAAQRSSISVKLLVFEPEKQGGAPDFGIQFGPLVMYMREKGLVPAELIVNRDVLPILNRITAVIDMGDSSSRYLDNLKTLFKSASHWTRCTFEAEEKERKLFPASVAASGADVKVISSLSFAMVVAKTVGLSWRSTGMLTKYVCMCFVSISLHLCLHSWVRYHAPVQMYEQKQFVSHDEVDEFAWKQHRSGALRDHSDEMVLLKSFDRAWVVRGGFAPRSCISPKTMAPCVPSRNCSCCFWPISKAAAEAEGTRRDADPLLAYVDNLSKAQAPPTPLMHNAATQPPKLADDLRNQLMTTGLSLVKLKHSCCAAYDTQKFRLVETHQKWKLTWGGKSFCLADAVVWQGKPGNSSGTLFEADDRKDLWDQSLCFSLIGPAGCLDLVVTEKATTAHRDAIYEILAPLCKGGVPCARPQQVRNPGPVALVTGADTQKPTLPSTAAFTADSKLDVATDSKLDSATADSNFDVTSPTDDAIPAHKLSVSPGLPAAHLTPVSRNAAAAAHQQLLLHNTATLLPASSS